MQLPGWSRNLLERRRRRREKAARRELFAPVRLSIRKLEERPSARCVRRVHDRVRRLRDRRNEFQ